MRAGDEREIDERLADWVDGCMSDRERERFMAELRVNPQLQKDLAEYERTVQSLRAALQAPTVSQGVAAQKDFADAVMARIAHGAGAKAATPVVRSRPIALLWSLVAAAALFTLAVLLDRVPSPHLEQMADAGKAAEPQRAPSSPARDDPAGADPAMSKLAVADPVATSQEKAPPTEPAPREGDPVWSGEPQVPTAEKPDGGAGAAPQGGNAGEAESKMALHLVASNEGGRAPGAPATPTLDSKARETLPGVASPDAAVTQPAPSPLAVQEHATQDPAGLEALAAGAKDERAVRPASPRGGRGSASPTDTSQPDHPFGTRGSPAGPATGGPSTAGPAGASGGPTSPKAKSADRQQAAPVTGSDDFFLGASRQAAKPPTERLPSLSFTAKVAVPGGRSSPVAGGGGAPAASAEPVGAFLRANLRRGDDADGVPAPAFQALRFVDVTGRQAPSAESTTYSGPADTVPDTQFVERLWLVEGRAADVQALVRQLSAVARTDAVEFANGEIDLLPAVSEATAPPAADKNAADAEEAGKQSADKPQAGTTRSADGETKAVAGAQGRRGAPDGAAGAQPLRLVLRFRTPVVPPPQKR